MLRGSRARLAGMRCGFDLPKSTFKTLGWEVGCALNLRARQVEIHGSLRFAGIVKLESFKLKGRLPQKIMWKMTEDVT